jgi:type I restriction enzyme M protein
MLSMNDELSKLNADARKLESVIGHNIRQIAGEE